MSGTWTNDWLCGLALIALTVVVHAIGLVAIGTALGRSEAAIQRGSRNRARTLVTFVLVLGTAGWMLAILHG